MEPDYMMYILNLESFLMSARLSCFFLEMTFNLL